MKKALLVVGLGVVAAGAGIGMALAKGDAPAPPVAQQFQRLQPLAGEWRGKGKVQMGELSTDATFSMSCGLTSGGHAVSCKSRISGLPGGQVIEETDLFGFDPGSNQYHWFAVTSMGETHDHVAKMPAGDTLEFVYEGLHDGKPMREAIDVTLSKDGKSMVMRNIGTIGGQLAWTMSGKVLKQ